MRFDFDQEVSEKDRQECKEIMAKIFDSVMAAAKRLNAPLEKLKAHIKDEEQRIFIRRSHYLYEQTQNPLFAWDVFKSCQKWGRPVPDWAIEYFMDCASLLLNFTDDGWPEGSRPVDFIPQVLGLSEGQGARSMFTQYNDSHKRLMIYLTVKDVEKEFTNKEITRQRGTDKFLIAGDRLGLSGDHVKKVFYSEKKALGVLGDEM